MCDYKKIAKIAEKYNLKVIYDAAHAFGVTVDDIGIGNIGDAAMFSFHATKVFHTIEGGALTYRDDNLKKDLDAWKMFGMYDKEDAEMLGTNAKLTEFAAAMGLCNLRHVNDEIAKRKKCVEKYREMLGNIAGIKLCKEQSGVISNYAYFPVYFDAEVFGKSRDDMTDILAKNDIFARKYFYPLTSEFTVYKDKFNIQDTPVAKDVSLNILTLPLYADLAIEDVEKEFVGANYGTFKRAVADAIVAELTPFQNRYKEIIASGELDRVLKEGAEQASKIAEVTLEKVKKAIGLYQVK